MKKVLTIVITAFLVAAGLSLPAKADYECEETKGVASFCGYFNTADISNDGKSIFAVETKTEVTDENEMLNDLEFSQRLVRINVATGAVNTLIDWTAPKILTSEMTSGQTREERKISYVDLSPNGKLLLLVHTVVEQTYLGPGDGVFAELAARELKREISVYEISKKKVTDLSKSMKLNKTQNVDGVVQHESIEFAYWASNSRDVLFLKREADGYSYGSYKVARSKPSKVTTGGILPQFVSANGKVGASIGAPGKDAELFNMSNSRLLRNIKGSKDTADWMVNQVQPKNSGKAFFVLQFEIEAGADQMLAAQVLSLDSKGKKKVLLEDAAGAIDLRYAERGKRLLILSNSYGLVLMKG